MHKSKGKTTFTENKCGLSSVVCVDKTPTTRPITNLPVTCSSNPTIALNYIIYNKSHIGGTRPNDNISAIQPENQDQYK